MKRHPTLIACLAIALSAAALRGDEPKTLSWSGKALDGGAVQVPAADKVSVLVFAMADQDRSITAMKQVAAALGQAEGVQAMMVVSGEDAPTTAADVAKKAEWPWAAVADPQYELSGTMKVRVWPTVVVVTTDGQEAGHLGGLSVSLADDIKDYVAFAQGRIDRATLDERLKEHNVAQSTPADVAGRHLEVAERLMERRQFDLAQTEIERGMKLAPEDARLPLAMARLEILTGDPAAALKRLNAVDEHQVIAWRIRALRGWALVELGEWDKAEPVLNEALKLNPDPAETYYNLGRCHEHQQDWPKAAAAYRMAFEHSAAGRHIEPAGRAD